MKYNDFIKETIMDFSSIEFKNIKALLIGEYIQFSFLEDNRIDQYIFSEKLCDYLEKLELKTKIPFQKHSLIPNIGQNLVLKSIVLSKIKQDINEKIDARYSTYTWI